MSALFQLRLLPHNDDSAETHEVIVKGGALVCRVFSSDDGDEIVRELNNVIDSYETA